MNYNVIYNKMINYRIKNKYDGYIESHHILPRSLGGTDDLNNLVNLTSREHYICHLLLTKMYDKGTNEYYKMIKAYNMMAVYKTNNQERDYKINSRLYESLKNELSKAMSISQTGKDNSQYGTCWVYNPTLKESKKISKNNDLCCGWIKGRVTDWNNHFSQKNCIVCNKKGLQSKLSKTCSKECTRKHKSNINISFNTDENKEIFKKLYIINGSIRKTLKSMGKVCGGNYHKASLEWINTDIEMLKIYNYTK